ncbi:hypothetical protein CC80DRAFT_513899 [Byssothecium circinans]|uniref:Uncharacterized protein n=1 Tax=Byssothecium circinans TaxID=147558 RepID=A0A6A5U5W9_9PLEO|nr:hypothetical protein CC80DRAFT_513899 [Byssothecium circinans]
MPEPMIATFSMGQGAGMAPEDILAMEQHDAVAIAGMGCRWPGSVRNTLDFWEFLKKRVDGWQEFDKPRFSSDGYHHENANQPGTMGMKGAYLLEEDARLFDHSFFGMSSLEVETMDPSQRKLLEVTYEAFENAGETWDSVSGTRTGVFDYLRPYAFAGAGTSILANQISYIFNLNGPSLTVNTACSSSMYALHLAMNAIRAGDCDAAVLGALSASGRSHAFDSRAEGYARGEGFGALYLKRASLAAADGSLMRALVRGEAVIREAYRNAGNLPFADTSYFECHGTGTYVGDPLEVAAVGNVFASEQHAGGALLIGSTKTNVGHGGGASALASIMKVVLSLEQGAIPPIFDLQTLNSNVDFKGAAVEVVRDLMPWPSGQVRRASINSFGYGGANAHYIIDHVHTLFPDYVKPGVRQTLNINATAFEQVMHQTSMQADFEAALEAARGLQATDSSLNGAKTLSPLSSRAGSTNAISDDSSDEPPHVRIKQHRPVLKSPTMTRMANPGTRQLVLLPFAAHSKESLKLNINTPSTTIGRLQLADVAYTLASKRSNLAQRTFRVVDSAQPAEGLAAGGKVMRSPPQSGNVAFVFTGQGSQWAGMGVKLFEYRAFASAITYLDRVLATLPMPPKWTLQHILSGKSEPKLIDSAEVSQAVCTALQVGLVDLLASWSVRPMAVAGHSSGEIAAAYASGRITAAEAIIAAYLRGQAVSRNEQTGFMLAVGLSHQQTLPYIAGLDGTVTIAAYNSPGSVTLSGDAEVIEGVSKALDQDRVFNRVLKTGGNAYHSHHMLALGVEYESMLLNGFSHASKLGIADVSQRCPQIPWMSSVTPNIIFSENDLVGPEYWRNNLESPMYFSDAVTNLVTLAEVHMLIEIGPYPALKSPIDQILKNAGKTSIGYASTMKRQQDGRESMLQLAGALFCLNTDVDLVAVNSRDSVLRLVHGSIAVDLPLYQYTYGPVAYHESRQSREYQYRQVIRHDLLGSKVARNAKLRPQWRNVLRIKDVPWLSDHRLLPDAVFPAAGYIATAVEAATRIHHEYPTPLTITGYSLRDVSIKSTLQIPEDDYGIELMTSMDLADAALAQTPTWVTFSISTVARDSDEWTEHCTGRIRVEIAENNLISASDLTVDPAARAADSTSWYKTFAAVGLGYGPTFRPLSHIRADTRTKNCASAIVALKTTVETMIGQSPYVLHPASLDGAIQLGLIACHNSQAEEASSAFVPVHFSQLYLSAGLPEDLGSANVVARGERHGLRGAHLDFVMRTPDGREILQVTDLCCSSYSRMSHSRDQAYSSPFTHNSQRRELFPPPLENLAYAIMYDIYETFAGASATYPQPRPSGEVGHFFEWIKRRGTLDDNELRREFKGLTSKERLAKIDELVSQAPHVFKVQTSKLLHENMDDILTERRTSINVIISKGLLTPLYQEGLLMTGVYPQLFNVLDSLGHANPNMRYIKISGGTGGATHIAMQAIRSANGIKSYHDYTFTDISPGFLATARETLSGSGFDDMIYNVLDAEQDPEANGYEPIYDVVLACQVLHATSDMSKTLTNVGKLLKPRGKLVLVETTQNFVVPGVVVGTFTGYWAGILDGRLDAPFMSVEMWDTNLKSAGFLGAKLVLDDFPSPYNTTSVIVSTFIGAIVPEIRTTISEDIQLLYSAEVAPPLLQRLLQEVEQRKLLTKSTPLQEAPSKVLSDSNVIVFLDEKHLQLHNDDRNLAAFQYLARSARSMTVLTSCGIAKGRNPDGALIAGLLRVLKTENPACQFLSIDIDREGFAVKACDTEASHFTRSIIDKVLELYAATSVVQNGNPTDRDRFVAVSQAEISYPKEYYLSNNELGETKPEMLPLGSQGSVHAAFEMPAVSLAYDDLEVWLGRVDTPHSLFEFAGTVTAISLAVNHLNVGDYVCGLSSGQFHGGDDAVRMATLPRSYSTVIYALEHIAHLPSERWTGKSMLVQSATTHIGIVAIILAKAKGADVFAMTGIAPSHIFTSNLPGAVNATKKGGFDIILSTAREDLDFLYMTPHYLQPMGHLIHVGRIERQSEQAVTKLDISLLSRKNATFSSVDLAVLANSAPALTRQLLQTVKKYLYVANLPRVLANFSKSDGYRGKLVVTFTDPRLEVKMVPPFPTAQFNSGACYVITGTLGGLGQSIIQRPVDSVHTAKRLIQSLSDRGVNVKPIICDVTDLAKLKSTIDQASSFRSIKGIVHAAVSWHDLSFDKLSVNRWRESLAAKVQGTKNLHEATRSMPLDFFVMTTSLLSVYALATQAAYTATYCTNNFQDAFARHRRALGLPASAMSFSLIRGVGETGLDRDTINTFDRNKTMTLSERQFLGLLEPAFLPQPPVVDAGADPLSAANLITALTRRQHALDQSSLEVASSGKSSTARLQQNFEAAILAGSAERSATVMFVEQAIAATVANMLFIDLEDVDPAKLVADYGVDSLIAAELRNWFLEALGTDISMLKLLD